MDDGQLGGFTAVPNEAVEFLGTGPIPAGPYYKPEFYALEREAIFKRAWLPIGRVSEVAEPKQFIVRPIAIADASVLIAHGADGQIRAFHNVCPHRGTQLVWEDSGKTGSFTCKYHAWNFGLNGAVRGIPDEERFFDLDRSTCGLREIAIGQRAGFLFVNLDPSPRQTLDEFLGPMAERMEASGLGLCTHFTEYVYEVEANWKTCFDNFQEDYHLRWIHPKSIGQRIMADVNPYGYPSDYGFEGLHRSQELWMNPEFQPADIEVTAYRYLSAGVDQKLKSVPRSTEYLCLFPNMFMLPRGNGGFSHTVWPLSPDRTQGVVRIYWTGEDPSASVRFGREFSAATLMDVHTEDRHIIEAGHRGLKSGALDYIQFQAQEALCRHFINAVMDQVSAYQAEIAAAEGAST